MRTVMLSVRVVAACVIVGTIDPCLAQQANSVNQAATPLPSADLCSAPGQQCLKPSNSAPTGIDVPPPPPRDLTLQYPGEKSLTDVDIATVAGAGDKLSKAVMPAVEEVGGKALGAIAEGAGTALGGVKAGIDVANAAVTGYSEGGVPGGVANVSKVGITNLVEAGAFDVTTTLTLPALGPLAPCAGVVVSCVAGAVTESVLERPLSPPSDYGFECAKTGSCAGGTSAGGNSSATTFSEEDMSQAVNAAVDAAVVSTDQQFDNTLAAAEMAQAKSGPPGVSEVQPSSSDATSASLTAIQSLSNTLKSVSAGRTSYSDSGATFLGCGPCAHQIGNSHQCQRYARGVDAICDSMSPTPPAINRTSPTLTGQCGTYPASDPRSNCCPNSPCR